MKKLKKPTDLSKIKILVETDADIAINQIDKLAYSVQQLNNQLERTAKLQGKLEQINWVTKILKLLTIK